MERDREKMYYWAQWTWVIVLIPLLWAGLHSLPRYEYSTNELVTIGLCGATALAFGFHVMKVGFLYLTFDGSILLFLLAHTQNYFIVVVFYLLINFCLELNKFIKYERKNYEALVYYSVMPAFTIFLAYNIASRLPIPDAWVVAESGFGVVRVVVTGFLIILISLWIELLNTYILRKKSYFLKLDIYPTPLAMQSIDSTITVVLMLVFPHIGILGFAIILAMMLAIMRLARVYYEESSLHKTFAKTVEALSKSMELGSFHEKAEDLIKELASIIQGCDCVLYMFDGKKDRQLPHIAAFHSLDDNTVMDPEDYCIDIKLNAVFMEKLGIVAGELYEVKNTALAELKSVGKRLITSRGFVATPIVGINGVEGMLLVLSEQIYLNKSQTRGIVSVVGKQLSTKLVNDTLFNRMEEHANRDSLTGLYSRRVFDNVISRYVEEGRMFSLALFDIDLFKSINDANGHPFGDLVLQKVADIMMMNSKGVDHACRYGGEELCILFDGLEGEVACTVAERIRVAVQEAYLLDGNNKPVHVTISGGVASYPHDGRTVKQIIDAADKALYLECKQMGRNKIARASMKDCVSDGTRSITDSCTGNEVSA